MKYHGLFYFEFNQETQLMNIYLSEVFQKKEAIPNRYYVLGYSDVSNFLHKYDHRKLNYFFDQKMIGIFDMMIRVKRMTKKKGYTKLHTLCYIKDEKMYCLAINYLDIIGVKKKIDANTSSHEISLMIESIGKKL